MTTSATATTAGGLQPRLFYRIVAIAEAVTWTLLIAGMVLKYVLLIDTPFTFAAGFLHGLVFITYAGTVILVGVNQHWPVGRIAFGIVTAIVPYTTIPFDRWLEKRGHLDGDWRRAATDDPRDHTRVGGLLRWMLNHPVILVTVFVVAVAAIVALLLVIGPPGGWGG